MAKIKDYRGLNFSIYAPIQTLQKLRESIRYVAFVNYS